MYGCESWTIKKAECWRIDAFELWCWRRLLRLPWTARRSNQSILKEISPGCSLVGLMLKLKLQYLAIWCEELTHLKRPWCWERLRAGGEEDDRGWDGWMASPTQWTWDWVDSRSWWWTGRPVVLWFTRLQSQMWLSDWTELKSLRLSLIISYLLISLSWSSVIGFTDFSAKISLFSEFSNCTLTTKWTGFFTTLNTKPNRHCGQSLKSDFSPYCWAHLKLISSPDRIWKSLSLEIR